MLSLPRLSALAVVLLSSCSLDLVVAHSAPARPLKQVHHPSTLALEILPRQESLFEKRSTAFLRSPTLRHSDSFRFILSAFDDTFYLHLRPNDHLVHPAARVNYYVTGPDGKSVLSHTEPLLRESVRAYWGEVIPAAHTSARMREDAIGVLPTSSRYPQLGWARIMVYHAGAPEQGVAPEFEGAFSVNGVVHHVMTKDNYLRTKHPLDPDISRPLDDTDAGLVIWRDSDVLTPHEEAKWDSKAPPAQPQTCGHDSLAYNTDPYQNAALQRPLGPGSSWYNPLAAFGGLGKRDDVVGEGMGTNFADSIGNSAACPKTQKVVYMGVATDCMYTARYGSAANATTQILKNWNTASSLYKNTFNISLGIVELQVNSERCPETVDPSAPWNVDCSSVALSERLSLFSDWRGKKGDDGAGLWHLMSGCPTGTEVGIAWLATLCVQISAGTSPSIVSGTAVSTSGRTEWQVIAHEIGHNFGAIHDCAEGCNGTSSCCPLSSTSCDADAKFIMSPVSGIGEVSFSPCSLGNICSLMAGAVGGRTNTSCVVDPDPNRATISLQMCGNGIVEAGEDCDPGKGTESACCNPDTCKFRAGARCDPGSSPCCTAECAFAPPTRVCRPARDAQCDVVEMCPGNSSACPADTMAPNGQSCGPDGLACATGICTSISRQCQVVGASMNLERACPNKNDNSCQVSCQDPTRSNTCILLQSVLLDGSPCGYGGTCLSGDCKTGGLLNTAKAWYTQNLQIAIPVSVVAGIVVLAILWSVIRGISRCCSKPRAPKTVLVDPAMAGVRHQRLPSFDPASQPETIRPRPPAMQTTYGAPTLVPTSLRPGAGANSSPPRGHRVERSQGGSQDWGRAYPARSGPGSGQQWVDESLWNGPNRR